MNHGRVSGRFYFGLEEGVNEIKRRFIHSYQDKQNQAIVRPLLDCQTDVGYIKMKFEAFWVYLREQASKSFCCFIECISVKREWRSHIESFIKQITTKSNSHRVESVVDWGEDEGELGLLIS